MEARWLAIVSLVLSFNILLPHPGYSAAHRAKSASKQSHQRTLAKNTVTKRVHTVTVASKGKPASKGKLATKSKTASKGKHAAKGKLASKRKIFKKLAHKPSKTNIWVTPIKTTPYAAYVRNRISANFKRGSAAKYSPEDLVRAKVFVHYPLKGGIRKRSGGIRHLVLHSTETGRPADARTIIRSWNNIGRSHPGTQYLVDRDGTIVQTADPNYATIHVNDRSAIRGVNNDNSIGIELVRQGKQKYTQKQLDSLVALVDYVKDRFNITKVYGHGEIQPSDRTDPVAFNWARFSKNLASIHNSQLESETAYNEAIDNTQG